MASFLWRYLVQPEGSQLRCGPDLHLWPGFNLSRVRLLVEQFALGGEEVHLPLLRQVTQRPTSLAEGEMLESGERKKILFCSCQSRVLILLKHRTQLAPEYMRLRR